MINEKNEFLELENIYNEKKQLYITLNFIGGKPIYRLNHTKISPPISENYSEIPIYFNENSFFKSIIDYFYS